MSEHSQNTQDATPAETVAWRDLGVEGFAYLSATPDGSEFEALDTGWATFPTTQPHKDRHNRELLRMMPAMMPIAEGILQAIGQKHPKRALYLEGPPGQGKTMMGWVLGLAMGQPYMRINCGDRPTSELLCEITINGQHGQSVFQHVNDMLAQCQPGDERVDLVRQTLEGVVGNEKAQAALLLPDADNGVLTPALDIKTMSSEERAKLAGRFVQTAQELGLNLSKDMSGGVVKKNGELLNALIDRLDLNEPDPRKRRAKPGIIALDEYSRRLDDGGALQELYEVLGGSNKAAARIRGGDGKEYVITSKMLADAGVFVLFTANPHDAVRDPRSKAVPPAVVDRIGVTECRTANATDFQYLMEMTLTGVPISGLNAIRPEDWSEPQFKKHLDEMLEYGLSDREKDTIPLSQRVFLSHYADVEKAASQLGKFLEAWRAMEDVRNTENPLYKHNRNADLKREIRERHSRSANLQVPITLRKVTELMDQGFFDQPTRHKRATGRKHIAPSGPAHERFGTNLCRYLQNHIQKLYQNSPEALKYFDRIMLEAGIAQIDSRNRDVTQSGESMDSGGNSGLPVPGVPIPDLLDVKQQMKVSEETLIWQKLLFQDVVTRYPASFNIAFDGTHFVDRETQQVLSDEEVTALAGQTIPAGLIEEKLARLPEEMAQNAGLYEKGPSAGTHPLLHLIPQYEEGTNKLTVDIVAKPVTALDPRGNESLTAAKAQSEEQEVWHGLGNLTITDIADELYNQQENRDRPVMPSTTELLMTLAAEGGKDAVLKGIFPRGFSEFAPRLREDNHKLSVSENRAPFNLGVTTLRFVKPYDLSIESEDGHEIRDNQEIVHIVRQGNEMLVVGDRKIDPKLADHLRKNRGVTYVSRKDDDAYETVKAKLEFFAGQASVEAEKITTSGSPIKMPEVMIDAFRHRNAVTLKWAQRESSKREIDPDSTDERVHFRGRLSLMAQGMVDLSLMQRQLVVEEMNVDLSRLLGKPKSTVEKPTVSESARSEGAKLA